MVLALVRDLMFSSKITATAREVGAAVKIIRDPAKLAGETGEKLIVDLNQDGAMEAASSWKQVTGKPVIGFVSHVDSATIERAKASGIDQILPRGQFTQILSAILQS